MACNSKPGNLRLKPTSLKIQRSTSYSPTHLRPRRLSWVQTRQAIKVFDSQGRDYSRPKFLALINKIREHLNCPGSHTRKHYETVVQRITNVLPTQNDCTVDRYFYCFFPTIRLIPWEEDLEKERLTWGLVVLDNRNEIRLRESMVLQYEEETDLEVSFSCVYFQYLALSLSTETIIIIFTSVCCHYA